MSTDEVLANQRHNYREPGKDPGKSTEARSHVIESGKNHAQSELNS